MIVGENRSAMEFDLVLEGARLPSGGVASIGILSGRIAAISPSLPAGRERLALNETLVLPGLVDAHIHLDKSLIGDEWHPHCLGANDKLNVRERVAIEREILQRAAPLEKRAAALVELAVSRGTTHLRSHVDVHPETGLKSLEGVLAVGQRYRDAVSIQIVAFPQRGLISCPGTFELLEEALKQGAQVIGGLDPSGVDHDVDGHLDIVFDLAERYGVAIDIHLHDPDFEGLAELQQIAQRTKALAMAGRVNVSHAYALGMVPRDDAQRVAEQLADAGVSILTNAPGNRTFPSVQQLRAAGVTVAAGNDNIRDAWWPYGDADMLERAMLIAYRSGFRTDEQLAIAFDLATESAARVLNLSDYGLRVGADADLVIVEARSIPEAVVARPRRQYVFKRGRLVARDGEFLGLRDVNLGTGTSP